MMCDPIAGILELVWNALDADADKVAIELVRTLEAITEIRIVDNGRGIAHADAVAAFSSLGGSWKALKKHSTTSGRAIHGKKGEGRYKALGLGGLATWHIAYEEDGDRLGYSIVLDADNPRKGIISDPQPTDQIGVILEIQNLPHDYPRLENETAEAYLIEHLAPYLLQYPGIEIKYDRLLLSPDTVIKSSISYPITARPNGGSSDIEGELQIVEWHRDIERRLYFCDSNGMSLLGISAGIHAPNLNFTAYLKSQYFEDLQSSGLLELHEADAGVQALREAAREHLRAHYRTWQREQSRGVIEEWKAAKIYPFAEEPANVVETMEREIFDVVAVTINDHGGLEAMRPPTKHLTLRLIKSVLQSNPADVSSIIDEVLHLPADKQRELAELLRRTSLEHIVSAARAVSDRLDFLSMLRRMVFEDETYKLVRERTQLHKFVKGHSWLFGEKFNLTVSDRSLTEVLRAHLKDRGDELDIADSEEVARQDGTRGIVDLMFGARIPAADPDQFDYLVVELKRPSVKIGQKVIAQIEEYAHAIAADPRFDHDHTRWTFVAVSRDFDDFGEMKAAQQGRARGEIHVSDGKPNMRIFIRKWSEYIAEAEGRLRFFQDKLQYEASNDSAADYVRRTHQERFMPEHLLNGGAASPLSAVPPSKAATVVPRSDIVDGR